MMRGVLLAAMCAVAASAVLATMEEPVSLLEDGEGGPGGPALAKMATGATAKADLALSKIKHAKELRAKARASLTAKGKPIPEILKAGALDDVSKRVAEAKRGSSGNKAALAKDDEEADEAKVKAGASGQKAQLYKKSEKGTKSKLKAEKKNEGEKIKAMKKKLKIQKKLYAAKADKKVTELEVKMKEKAKEKMSAGYVMSGEKTHGGPQIAAAAAGIKNDLEKFVEGYEQAHSKITNDVAVADQPTE